MKTLKQLIEEKKFDYVSSDITEEKFPIVDVPKDTEYTLFQFGRISSKDAIKKMEKEGWRAANISELLSWKDWNNKDCVVALGSVAEVGGGRGVPCLDGDGSERSLILHWFDGGWDSVYRFLAMHTSSLKSSETDLGDLESLALRVEKIEKILAHLNEKFPANKEEISTKLADAEEVVQQCLTIN